MEWNIFIFILITAAKKKNYCLAFFSVCFFFFWEKTKAFKAHKKKWKLKNTNKFFKQINLRENETL